MILKIYNRFKDWWLAEEVCDMLIGAAESHDEYSTHEAAWEAGRLSLVSDLERSIGNCPCEVCETLLRIIERDFPVSCPDCTEEKNRSSCPTCSGAGVVRGC